MSVDVITQESLDCRERGDVARYITIHNCTECGCSCLCPDRYIKDRCGPMELYKKQGWQWSYACTPCMAKFDDENREAWYKAHGLEEAA